MRCTTSLATGTTSTVTVTRSIWVRSGATGNGDTGGTVTLGTPVAHATITAGAGKAMEGIGTTSSGNATTSSGNTTSHVASRTGTAVACAGVVPILRVDTRKVDTLEAAIRTVDIRMGTEVI